MFSPCLRGFPPGAPVSFRSPKDVLVRCIGHAKFPLSVPNRRWNMATRGFSQSLHCSVDVTENFQH